MDLDTLAEIREWVGSQPSDIDVEEVWDRVGTVHLAALSILRQRRAELTIQGSASSPNFTVPGEYSQSIGDPIRALDEKIAQLEAITGEGGGAVTTSKLVRCDTGR